MSLSIIVKPGDVNFYADAAHERKPAGVILIDNKEVASTCLCPHCGSHFVSRKGSGAKRTFCGECNAVTCGRKGCCGHVEYFLKTIDRIEAEARRGY